MSLNKTLTFSYVKNLPLRAFVAYLCNVVFGQKELTRTELLKIANAHFNDAFSTGEYSLPYLYELLQVAFNLGMYECSKRGDFALKTDFVGVYERNYETIQRMAKLLPTHTVRDEDKIAYQQFSTPPHYAYLAAVAGQPTSDDVVWEPSCGAGGLLCYAAGWLKPEKVYANEIDLERWQLMQDGFGELLGSVTKYDAGKLHLLMQDEPKPTLVLMNPPFSVDQGTKDPMTAARHIDSMLQMLEVGGRLVAIVSGGIDWGKEDADPNGMAPDAARFRDWWKGIESQYTIRCNIGVNGDVYKKFGTDFRTRLVVIDHVGPQGEVRVYTTTSEGKAFVDSPAELFTDADFRDKVLDSRMTPAVVPLFKERLTERIEKARAKRIEPDKNIYLHGGTEAAPVRKEVEHQPVQPADKQKFLGGLPAWRMTKLLYAHDLHAKVIEGPGFQAKLHNGGWLPLTITCGPLEGKTDKRLIFAHHREDGSVESALHFDLGLGLLALRSISYWGPLGVAHSRTNISGFANMMSKNILDQGFEQAQLEMIAYTPDGKFSSPALPSAELQASIEQINNLMQHGTTTKPEPRIVVASSPRLWEPATPPQKGGELTGKALADHLRAGGLIPEQREVIAVVDFDEDSSDSYTTVEYDAEAGTSAAVDTEAERPETTPEIAEIEVATEPVLQSRKMRHVMSYSPEHQLSAVYEGDELVVRCWDAMFPPQDEYVVRCSVQRWEEEFEACPPLREWVAELRKVTEEMRQLGHGQVPADVPVQASTEPVEEATDVLDTFHGYRPFVEVPDTHPHNVTLVESGAMKMARLPFATAEVHLPEEAIKLGRISDAQAENVIYAIHAHQQRLNDGRTRRGYMIGDGTGVGKGCQGSAIAMHYFLKNKGKVRVLWVSKEPSLIADAKRDWTWVGGAESFVHSQDKQREQKVAIESGIMFTTYSTMYRRGTPEVAGKKGADGKVQGYRAATVDRMQQIIDWKPDVILWDESHLMGNAVARKGARGMEQPSARALAGLAIQAALPDAAVVYLSATAATEVHNFGYAAERLGLCGPNVPGFPDLATFIKEIESAGMLGMELVARDMKAMGVYNARSLSYHGTEFQLLQHTLTEDQIALYNEACYFWRMAYDWAKEGFEINGTNSQGKADAMGQFWGAAQRFYNQILIALQTPTAIEDMLVQLRAGHSIVVQLVSTNEASTKRIVGEALANEQSLDDLDLTPKDALLNFVKKCFPVIQYEEYSDSEGNTRTRVLRDSEGEAVLNPQSVRMQTELLIRVAEMRTPKGALDQVLERMDREGFPFAEVSGRSARYLKRRNPDTGEFEVKHESRSKAKGDAEAAEFMADLRRGILFSGAGNTGRSFHSDLRCQNQRRRYHYVLEAGWRADAAIQGLGRSHRTNQANAPFYKLVTTNLPGQKRFITSIARRIEQLGSLTKGDRKAASNSMFSDTDNLETEWAYKAISDIFYGLYSRNIDLRERIGYSFDTLCDMMGFNLIDHEEGGIDSKKLPDVPQFLNRMLFLPVEAQFRLFTTFEELHGIITENARAKGLLDRGMEKIVADRIVKLSEQLVYSDPKTGSRTNVVELECFHANKTLGFDTARHGIYPARSESGYSQQWGELVSWVTNTVSGRVYGLWRSPDHTEDSGMVVSMVRQTGPTGHQREKTVTYDGPNWKRISEDDARILWEQEEREAPKFKTERLVLITGAILPVWAQLSFGGRHEVRVVVAETEKGERIMGRALAPAAVAKVLSNLGVTSTGVYLNNRELLQAVLQQEAMVELANGWRINRRKLGSDYRVVVTGCTSAEARAALLKNEFHARDSYYVMHVPKKWEDRLEVWEEFTKFRPVVRITSKDKVVQDVVNKELEQSLEMAQQLEEVTSYSFAELINWHPCPVPLTESGKALVEQAELLLAEAEAEVVEAPVEAPAMHVSNLVDCPHCGAEAGSYCVRSGQKPGTPVVAHQARKALAEPKAKPELIEPTRSPRRVVVLEFTGKKPEPVAELPAPVAPLVLEVKEKKPAPAPVAAPEPDPLEGLTHGQRVQKLYAGMKRNAKTVKLEMAGQTSFF